MSDLFMSYFHDDRPTAEAIARALETVGWSVWWDRTIPAGAMFDQVIETELNEAKLVIVLWSQRAARSRWVLNESEEAAARNILVPILIEPNVHIPLAFRRIQAADLVAWDGDVAAPRFQHLVDDIVERIGPPPGAHEEALIADSTDEEEGGDNEAPPAPTPEFRDISPVPHHSGRTAPHAHALERHTRSWLLETRAGLTWILAAVFGLNYAETMVETVLRQRYGWGGDLGTRLAAAFRGLEGNLSFESHDATNWMAVYGYSISYFFLLPILGFGVAVALWRRSEVRAYRIFCLAVAINYLVSLGFFLFFPVPERWAYPESGAILLSDRWSSTLIEWLRPISGMDNCFPSSHVSLTVLVVLVSYLFRVRLRHTVMVLGMSVIFSTFVLGIHWLPDIVAGVAVGFLSVAAARYVRPVKEAAISRRFAAFGREAVLRTRHVAAGAVAHS